MTSAESAARFHALRSDHLCPGCRKNYVIVRQNRRGVLFREFILERVGRVPKRTTALFYEVDDDWGGACPRRFQRALARLRDDGAIVRTEDGWVKPRRPK